MEAECSSKAQRLSLDTINALPQTIIETILCLLPVDEAARTSILSSEWRYKWTKIPKLVFRYSARYKSTDEAEETPDMASARKNMDSRCKLFYAIQQVLLLRQGPIHEFTLNTKADYQYYEIDQIILHLSRNHTIKKLTLDLYYATSYIYKLPLCVFSLHHLTDLRLCACDLNHKPTFSGFGSLRSLYMKHVTISTKALLHLLSNCPSLKSFSLLIERDLGREDCTVIELFECLHVIEYLTIWDDTLRMLDLDSVLKELPPSLIHLKYFCFKDMSFAYDHRLLTFLAVLIKCSPNLEKIKIKIHLGYAHDDDYEIRLRILEELYSEVWLEHLKELEVINFSNLKPEMEFVKFILARSPKLKKVSITSAAEHNEEFNALKFSCGPHVRHQSKLTLTVCE